MELHLRIRAAKRFNLPARCSVFKHVLGTGTFGTVYQGQLDNDTPCAVKIAKFPYARSSIQNELHTLQALSKHPNIIGILGGSATDGIIVYALCGSSVCAYIDRGKDTVPLCAQFVGRQIASGLEYLHSQMLVHMDIKPENILIGPGIHPVDLFGKRFKPHVVIADLGACQPIATPSDYAYSQQVTAPYRAPDIILGSVDYTPATDMWSFGILYHQIATHSTLSLFETTCTMQDPASIVRYDEDANLSEHGMLLNRIACFTALPTSVVYTQKTPKLLAAAHKYRKFHVMKTNVFEHIDNLGTRLIIACLTYAPSDRLTATQVLEMLQ